MRAWRCMLKKWQKFYVHGTGTLSWFKKRIDDIKQAKKDGVQNVKLIQIASEVTNILANSKPHSVQKILSNGEE